jgi:hypothetical protein
MLQLLFAARYTRAKCDTRGNRTGRVGRQLYVRSAGNNFSSRIERRWPRGTRNSSQRFS